MADDSQSYNLSILRRLLREAFSPDELEELVSYDENFKDQEFGDLVDEFAPADSIRVMARKTVDWCCRHGRIDYLVQRVKDVRSEKYKEFKADLKAPCVPEAPTPSPPSSEPGPAPIRTLRSRWLWIAIGLALVLIVAIIVWLLFFQPGSLQVTKVVDVAGAVGTVDVPDFTICIEGPSYLTEPDCKTFSYPHDLVQTWSGLRRGDYKVTEPDLDANWALPVVPDTVTVKPGDDPVQVTVTNTLQPGSLQVTKEVDTAGAVGAVNVPDFSICIEGPSYPTTPDCKTFGYADDLVQTWSGLIPGEYKVTELDLGANWAITIPPTVTVSPGDEPAEATVSNTFQPGSLQVTRVVDVAGAVGTVDVPDFTICIEGPSYLTEPDCKTFSHPDELEQTWRGLRPGEYKVTEEDLDANWAITIPPTITVSPGDAPTQATVTNTFQPGGLQVTRVVDVAGAVGTVDVPDFTICIEGPSYLTEPDCKTFSHPDELEQTWRGLRPGEYKVTEEDLDANWAITIPPTVTVSPGDEPAEATVTNTFQPGSLQVTRVVDVAGAVGTVDVPDFTICIEGPSYLTEPDCKTFSYPDELEQTWRGLRPGEYKVTEEDLDANWAITIPPTVTVSPGDAPTQATVTNTFQPGSLQVTRVVDFAGTVDVPDFTICIQGPSYPTTPNCKTFSYPDDLVHTWSSLIAGDYTVTEQRPDANWALTDVPTTITVNPGADPAQVTATVTNTLPMIATGKWTNLAVSWPCIFEGSLPWDAAHNGFWCQDDWPKLSIIDHPPEDIGDSFDIWWPSGDKGSLRVLRPGTAYEARFIPYEVGNAASYGIAIRNGQNVIYRFLFRVTSEDHSQTFDIQLLEEAPDSSPGLLAEEEGTTLSIGRWSDAAHYRLRIERHRAGLVFRWKAGEASQEWGDLYQLPLPQGDENYQMGWTIEGVANVVIPEIELKSSAHVAPPPAQQEGIVVVDDSDRGFHMYPDSSRFHSPFMQEKKVLEAVKDSMKYSVARAENPSSAEWCTALEKSGKHEVQVHIPNKYAGHGYAIYEIEHAEGVASVPVNQAAFGGEWAVLGVFHFTQGEPVCVRLSDLGEQPWHTGYDAVRWIPREPDA